MCWCAKTPILLLRFETFIKHRHFSLNNVYLSLWNVYAAAHNFDSCSSDSGGYLKKCLVPEYLFTRKIAWFNNISCSSCLLAPIYQFSVYTQMNLKIMRNWKKFPHRNLEGTFLMGKFDLLFPQEAPVYWRDLDPYWQGRRPLMRRYFHPDGSQTADPDDRVWGGHECCFSTVTSFAGDDGKIREHYVRINRWPRMFVSRNEDWSWEMSNHFASYSSIADADKDGGTGPL